jgi:hypothetical protein
VDSGSFDSAPKAADLSEHIPIEAVEAEPEAPDEPNLRASDLNFREVGINTWKVKVAIGLIYDFSDISTLKKYLGDKKVTPDDLISHNNKDWKRIGDIPSLDEHFVAVWRNAKRLIETGEVSVVKPKSKPKPAGDSTGRVDATLSGQMDTVSRTGTHSTIPGAYGGRKSRSARQKQRAKEQAAKKPPFALMALAAILVVGGVLAWAMRPDATPTAVGPAPVDAEKVGEVSEAEMSAIEKKIQEDLAKKQAETMDTVKDELQEIGVEARKKTLEERIAAGELERVPATRPPAVSPKRTDGFRRPRAIEQDTTKNTQSSSTAKIDTKTSDPGQMYLKMARKKLAGNDFGAAAKAAETATRKSPACVPCWNTLGEAYKKLGKPQEASAAFAKAESLAGGAGSSQAGQ